MLIRAVGHEAHECHELHPECFFQLGLTPDMISLISTYLKRVEIIRFQPNLKRVSMMLTPE